MFAEVVVELPVEGVFSYRVPGHLSGQARPGKRVLVPFGKRVVTGFIIGMTPEPGVEEVKDVVDVLDPVPLFDEKRLKFYRWLSGYYFSPLGQVLSLMNPGAGVKSQRFLRLKDENTGERNWSGVQKEVLEHLTRAKGKAVSLSTLASRLKGKAVYSAIEKLKREGVIEEEARLKGGGTGRVEKSVALLNLPEEPLKRSPLQEKVLKYLSTKRESGLKEMTEDLGDVAHAVRRLADRGFVEIKTKSVIRDPLSEIVPRMSPENPTDEQKAAVEKILSALNTKRFSPFLLYGVTASGKTLVYIKVLEEVFKAGKKALFLVPEIALTPWPAAYLKEKFPGRVALFHSGLSPGERYDTWRRVLQGEVDVVVGARSALFSPLPDISLIIVDEEHDPSYKQEEGVRYNGRDSALMLGKFLGATVILGSATPSLETFFNSKTGKITPLFLRKRVGGSLPAVELVDMRGKKGVVISDRLRELLKESVERNEQALLFLNRRGYSNSVVCKGCGHAFRCVNCSVTLTLHGRPRKLLCHYCNFSSPVPDTCPSCKGDDLIDPGTGTEKVQEEVKKIIPGGRVLRLDRDAARKKGAVKSIMEAFDEKKAEVLVGTQMVSKGHHFPSITLAGIISGDTSLNIPDFRSSERTFQLVTQASGRAGRGSQPGKVVVQTLSPEHYVFRNACRHDYECFFEEEIKLRRESGYPPFTRLCALRVEGRDPGDVLKAVFSLEKESRKLSQEGISVLGPVPAMVERVKGRTRWQLLIKGKDAPLLHSFVRKLRERFEGKKEGSGVTLTIDMDPLTVV